MKTEMGPKLASRLGLEMDGVIDGRLRALLLELAHYCWRQYNTHLTITCLNRTPEENERVGGIKYSAHLSGRAADIRSGNIKRYIADIKDHLKGVWGDAVYVVAHDSGRGHHLHINFKYRR
jgi:uncharacterized protein YcbK (DUF882 family)